jgi:hypothetical protein
MGLMSTPSLVFWLLPLLPSAEDERVQNEKGQVGSSSLVQCLPSMWEALGSSPGTKAGKKKVGWGRGSHAPETSSGEKWPKGQDPPPPVSKKMLALGEAIESMGCACYSSCYYLTHSCKAFQWGNTKEKSF